MKQLVISACLVDYHDDNGAQHQDVGDLIDVTKVDAETLAIAGRTLYVERSDDPTKTGQYTASEAMLKAVAAANDKGKKPA